MGRTDVEGREASAIAEAVTRGCRRLLEIGCGAGRVTAGLVERGLFVDAVESDAVALERAARMLRHSKRVRLHAMVPDAPRRWSAVLFSHSL